MAFQNDAVTIFEIPQMTPPSLQSNFIILNPLEPDTAYFEHNTTKYESVLQTIPSLLHLNYTISSLPTEDNATYVAIEGFRTSSQWTTTEGIGSISLNETDHNGESTAIDIYNLTADKNGYFAVSKNGIGDFTKFDYLHLWIEVSSDINGEVKVILRGDNGTYAMWLIQNFPKNEWFPLTLQLTNPTLESTPQLDLSATKQVEFGFQKLTPNASYSFLNIGEIQGMTPSRFLPYEGVNSLFGNSSTIMLTQDPNYDTNSLIRLAESGSKIIVFNTDDDNKGFFFDYLQLSAEGYVESNGIDLSTNIHIPQVQVPNISTNSTDVSTIFYYKSDGISVAPFVIVKKLGLGEIIYVMLPSNVINALETTAASLLAIFNEIAALDGLQIAKVDFSAYPLGSYNTLEGLTTVNGTVEISAVHMFNTNPLQSSGLEIRTGSTSEILSNITIDSLKVYGSAQLVLDGQSISMQANSVSSYLTIFSDALERPCTLELSDNTIADLQN